MHAVFKWLKTKLQRLFLFCLGYVFSSVEVLLNALYRQTHKLYVSIWLHKNKTCYGYYWSIWCIYYITKIQVNNICMMLCFMAPAELRSLSDQQLNLTQWLFLHRSTMQQPGSWPTRKQSTHMQMVRIIHHVKHSQIEGTVPNMKLFDQFYAFSLFYFEVVVQRYTIILYYSNILNIAKTHACRFQKCGIKLVFCLYI